jgi:hypothetical protein
MALPVAGGQREAPASTARSAARKRSTPARSPVTTVERHPRRAACCCWCGCGVALGFITASSAPAAAAAAVMYTLIAGAGHRTTRSRRGWRRPARRGCSSTFYRNDRARSPAEVTKRPCGAARAGWSVQRAAERWRWGSRATTQRGLGEWERAGREGGKQRGAGHRLRVMSQRKLGVARREGKAGSLLANLEFRLGAEQGAGPANGRRGCRI